MKKLIAVASLLLLILAGNAFGSIVLSGGSNKVILSTVSKSYISVTGASNVILNIVSYETTVDVDASCTVTNSIGYNTISGDEINIAAGQTVTGTYNSFADAAKAGDGTYSDGSSTTLWSTDPVFTDAAGGDFSLLSGSPAINAGTDVCSDIYTITGTDTYDLAGRLVCNGFTSTGKWLPAPTIGAYSKQNNSIIMSNGDVSQTLVANPDVSNVTISVSGD